MDKELLFKARLAEADVEVAGVGTVRVRALSRDEVFTVQQIDDLATSERKILSFGMVDPEMTVAEVAKWQMASPAGEMEPVTDKIQELSGLSKGADKAAVLDFPDEAGSGAGVLPGVEVGDDGGRAAPDDEQ